MITNKVALAVYARLSRADGDLGEDGKDESNSIEHQKDLIYEFIESREEFAGMKVQEYVDDGYTGSNFDRPGFQNMMDAVRQKKIAVIIVKDLSRFGVTILVLESIWSRSFQYWMFDLSQSIILMTVKIILAPQWGWMWL